MSIYKKDGHYIVKVSINGKQILRRQYLGRTIVSKDQVLDFERDLYLEFSDRQKDYNIDELFGLYEDFLYKRYKETSARRYMYTFNFRIKQYFIGHKVSDITRSYLVFVNESINRQSYKDINYLIKLCKQFVDFMYDYGLKTSVSSLYEFRKNKLHKRKFDFYTFEEFTRFYLFLDTDYLRLMFSLFYYYGLRMGELRALQVCDFEVDRVVINKELTNKGRFGGQKLLEPKTNNSNRYYPYVKDIKELFNKVVKELKLKNRDFVFKGQNGVISERTIKDRIIKYSKMAGLRYITPHSFRHSCVSYLYNNNVDIKDISSWVGHSSVNVTLRVYAHLFPVRKENVANAIDSKNSVK